MKKRVFFFLGLLCSFGYYSCQKSINESGEAEATLAARKSPPACESDFFDPTHLISASQH
jgi:hypothetical protein